MYNRITVFGAAMLLGLLLSGCAATNQASQEQAAPAKQAQPAAPAMAADPCAGTIAAAVQQARTGMKTVKETCGDLRIRANPMWDMDYAGNVHLIIHDAAGKLVLDEFRKP